jgi:thiol-disulfide isomerase/thioredoxin
MKKNAVIWIVVFAVFIAAALFAYRYLSGRTGDAAAQSGAGYSSQGGGESDKPAAPDFTVYDKDGDKVSLSDNLGTPVVINFWASWCPPCRSELPDFDAAAADYDGKVVFMMVNLTDGQRETKEKALQFMEDNGYNFNILLDSDHDAATAYGINSIPTTIFVDRDGHVSAGYTGAISRGTIDSEVEKLLGGE